MDHGLSDEGIDQAPAEKQTPAARSRRPARATPSAPAAPTGRIDQAPAEVAACKLTSESVAAFLKENGLVVVPIGNASEIAASASPTQAVTKTHMRELLDRFQSSDPATDMKTLREPTASLMEEDDDALILTADPGIDYVWVQDDDNGHFGGHNARGVDFYRELQFRRVQASPREGQKVALLLEDGTKSKGRKGCVLMGRPKAIGLQEAEALRKRNDPQYQRPDEVDRARYSRDGSMEIQQDAPIRFSDFPKHLPERSGDPEIEQAWERLSERQGGAALLDKVVSRAMKTLEKVDGLSDE